jgi:hypothetical protein
VSELIGFVLVFSLVVAVVGIVSIAGLSTLQDAADAEKVDNAERAMEVLADNVGDLRERGAPSRATEISLEDAQIIQGDPIEVRVFESSSPPSFDERYEIQPIIYRETDNTGVGQTSLVYVMGSVFRVERNGGVVLREWSTITDSDRVLLPVTNTTADAGSPTAISSSTVLIRTNVENRSLLAANTTGQYDDVVMRVTTPRRDLWHRMLDDRSAFDCRLPDGDDYVECDLTVDPQNFYVTYTRIDVALKP